MDTRRYILEKYKIHWKSKPPVEIPNTNRESLAELFNELGFTVGAEIGVLKGAYAKVLCEKNPDMKLYCVDPYFAYDGFLRGEPNQAEQDEIFAECKKVLEPYNCAFVRKMSIDAAKDFADDSLDFFYLDANHRFEYVVADLAAWIPKVRPGGVISGHDFHRMAARSDSKNNPVHIIPALMGYTDAYKITPWFILGERKGKPGDKRERYRSWFWVKS